MRTFAPYRVFFFILETEPHTHTPLDPIQSLFDPIQDLYSPIRPRILHKRVNIGLFGVFWVYWSLARPFLSQFPGVGPILSTDKSHSSHFETLLVYLRALQAQYHRFSAYRGLLQAIRFNLAVYKPNSTSIRLFSRIRRPIWLLFNRFDSYKPHLALFASI